MIKNLKMKSTKSEMQENLREELLKYLEEDEKFKSKLDAEFKEEKLQRRKELLRRLELEKRETYLHKAILKAQELATLGHKQVDQEEKLAAELDLLKRQEIVEQKMRQHLRENSHELKEFESQLKAAYVKKAIAVQLAEKEANKMEEQITEMKAREVLERAIGTVQQQEEEDRLKEQRQKQKFRSLLQDQIIEKEQIRQHEFIAFMKEKKLFDEILEAIKNEEIRELEQKKIMQEKLKTEMEQFYKAREMWKAAERLKLQEEEEKRRQINDEKAKTKAANQDLKKLKEENFQKIYDKLNKELTETSKKIAEREDILEKLKLNEQEEKEKEKAKQEMAKELARKEEARASYKQLLAAKAIKEKEEKEFDARLAQMMKEKMEEEERKEKEKQEQRRAMLISNRKYNEEAMKRNICKRAESLKLTQLINDFQEKEEKRKAELIEEERIRMLKEHAPKLIGFFPKGCLREKDLEVLGMTENSPLPESHPAGRNG